MNLVLPSHESILNTLDKSKILRIAEEFGIPTPLTFYPTGIADVIKLLPRIRYPAVIKPRWSYVWNNNGKADFARPCYVDSSSELVSTYSEVEKKYRIQLADFDARLIRLILDVEDL